MADTVTPLEFQESLYSQKHTFHQLRMKLQNVRRGERFDALLGVFSGTTHFGNQEMAGQLLTILRPECRRTLDEILLATLSTWNASVEQLPYYLRDVFGHDAVVDATERLK